MENQLNYLLDRLNLEKIDDFNFIGKNYYIGSPNVYGGQVLAQAIFAANKTVQDNKSLHSIHAYFIHPGNNDLDIHYEVQIIKDGKSFNTRKVSASQNGKEIFTLIASYQTKETGIEHQATMPNVARPDSLTSFSEIFRKFAEQFDIKPRGIFAPDGPFIFHPVEYYDPFSPKISPAIINTWFKTNGSLPKDEKMHQVALAYASDFNLLITALLPHGLSFFTTPLQIASLDHAMWFHRPAPVDEWLLYVVESSNASNGRAFCSGKIFTQDGLLIASTAQEGLIRKL